MSFNPTDIINRMLHEVHGHLGVFAVKKLHDDPPNGEEPRYYIAQQNGHWEMYLGQEEVIETIFLYLRRGCDGILGITADVDREAIIRRFGEPCESGEPQNTGFIGKVGAWEKYDMDHFVLHIEHLENGRGIKMLTLMKKDG